MKPVLLYAAPILILFACTVVGMLQYHLTPKQIPPTVIILPSLPPPPRGTPIDATTAEAWKKAGFQIRDDTVISRGDDQHFGVPHVRLVATTPPDPARLPEIVVPFALELNGSEKADWLRQLPGLKNVVFVRGGTTGDIRGGATDDVIAVLADFGLLHTLFEARANRSHDGYVHGTRPTTPDEVVVLDLHGTGVTGASVKHLAGLKNLVRLGLSGTATSDVGLEDLARLPSLTSLRLDNTRITDAGLKYVAGLRKLEALMVGAPGITGAGLERISGMENLTSLFIWGPRVKNGDLQHLAKLKRLKTLGLGTRTLTMGSQITDAGLEYIGKLTNLTDLILMEVKFEGDGLRHLADLPNLTSLDLRGTGEPGRRLKQLAGCKRLSKLNFDLAEPGISDAMIEGLVEAGLLHLLEGAKTADGQKPAQQEQVASLDLRNSRITNKSAEYLARLKSLTLLKLGERPFFNTFGEAELQKALPDCRITREP